MILFERYLLSASTIASVLSIASGAVQAGVLPSGGHYVSGKGEIGNAGQSVTVKQSSTFGIIDWNKFSIGSKSAVSFDNGSGATLNRVTGGNLSTIAGSLDATGSLYLINSQGVIVSGTGRVVTGGSFIASSGSIGNETFDSDDPRRIRNARAAITNRGTITSGGLAALIGGSVANSGIIDAARVSMRAESGSARDSGTIHATGNERHDAKILVISETSKTSVTGDLVAHNRDGSGGLIETSGHEVSVGGHIDAGSGGDWLIDPENLTVTASAAKAIDKSLADGTNVTLKTTKTSTSGPGTASNGSGDIIVGSAITWSSAATLTLDSYHSLLVDAAVRVAGNGRLALLTDDNGGKGGVLTFVGGNVSFDNTKDILGINRQSYTLVNDIATLASDIKNNPSGDFALANNYDAKSNGAYATSPITAKFDGKFDGLGNEISNLAIDDGSANDTVGLFAEVLAKGTICNLTLSDVEIVGNSSVGALVGLNNGLLQGDMVSGRVQGDTYVGGMVGSNTGSIAMSSSAVSVLDTAGTEKPSITGSLVGDLVGYNEQKGSITSSVATGDVTAERSSDVGGLVGRNAGTVETSNASGTIRGFNATGGLVGNNESTIEDGSSASGDVYGTRYVGGLVGWNFYGSVDDSHASGTVTAATGGKDEGGLVGYLGDDGKIINSYASGTVAGNNIAGGLVGFSEGSISLSFAKGEVTGADDLGGFVGENFGRIDQSYSTDRVEGDDFVGGFAGENVDTKISNSYATGAVSGTDQVGGFAGLNQSSSSTAEIEQSYSTGEVIGKQNVGGFLGESAGNLSAVYWDTKTSGLRAGIGLKESGAAGNAKGLTTTQLQSALPSGFDASVWAINSKINGGVPYLLALANTYH